MIKFSKPTELNGEQLVDEIKKAHINIIKEPLVDGNGDLWLDVSETDETAVSEIVKNHIAVDYSAVRTAAKAALLAKLGITEDEAKLLLS